MARTRAVAVTAMALYTALAVLVIVKPALSVSATLSLANGIRAIGHSALDLPDGFVLAMAVTVLTVPLPSVLAGVFERRFPTIGVCTGASALAAAAAITAVSWRTRTPVNTAVSASMAVFVGLLLGALLLQGVRQLRGRHGVLPHATGRSRVAALMLTVIYAFCVALIGFHGSPVDAPSTPTLVRVFTVLQHHGLPVWAGYSALEFSANIVFFIPLGLLVVLLIGGRWWWVGCLLGFAASAFIEIMQALFLPARFASLDDVLSNTAGALIGTGIGIVVLAAAARRRDRERVRLRET